MMHLLGGLLAECAGKTTICGQTWKQNAHIRRALTFTVKALGKQGRVSGAQEGTYACECTQTASRPVTPSAPFAAASLQNAGKVGCTRAAGPRATKATVHRTQAGRGRFTIWPPLSAVKRDAQDHFVAKGPGDSFIIRKSGPLVALAHWCFPPEACCIKVCLHCIHPAGSHCVYPSRRREGNAVMSQPLAGWQHA